MHKRFAEFAREYNCTWIKPWILYHTTVSDRHILKLLQKAYPALYTGSKLKLSKKLGGGTLREFFEPSLELLRAIYQTMHDDVACHAELLYVRKP